MISFNETKKYKTNPTNIINAKVCLGAWMFVAQSRRNYATDISEILYIRSLGSGIIYRILFIPTFFNRSGPNFS